MIEDAFITPWIPEQVMNTKLKKDTPLLNTPPEDIARPVGLLLRCEREIKIFGSSKGLWKTGQFFNDGKITPD